MVQAMIKQFAGDYRSNAHCGRCGQYLWTIEGSPIQQPAQLDSTTARGWCYDTTREQWEPSARHQEQR
jgi:hypothetical protein